MSRFRVSDQAQEDLEQIWLYIAQVGNYIIFYRQTEDGIEVVRVLSGYRDLDRLFER